MRKLLDAMRAREALTRRVCRVISVLAFVLGVIALALDRWAAGALAIAVLAVTEVLIPRKL